jgi:hypothetical protein
MPETTDPSAAGTNAGKNAKGGKEKDKKTVDPTSGNKDKEVFSITKDDLNEEQKAQVQKVYDLFKEKVLSAFTKSIHGKAILKGMLPDPFCDIDLSTPSEERSAALREVINEMMGHTFNRQGTYLVNSLEAIIRRVIKENEKGETSVKGPTLGSYKGEESLFRCQPKRNQVPPPPSKIQYLLYPIEGGILEGQVNLLVSYLRDSSVRCS